MEAATPATIAPLPHGDEWLRAARLTRLLSWLSLVWLGIEGTVAIVAGIMAGSVALIAFGLDSAIEGVASTWLGYYAISTRPARGRSRAAKPALP